MIGFSTTGKPNQKGSVTPNTAGKAASFPICFKWEDLQTTTIIRQIANADTLES